MENMLRHVFHTCGHPRSAGSWECPGLSLSSVQVCLHSGVISELNYFGQPQLCCDWFLTCHQLLIIYCSKTHSKPAVGLINQDSQGAGVGGAAVCPKQKPGHWGSSSAHTVPGASLSAYVWLSLLICEMGTTKLTTGDSRSH